MANRSGSGDKGMPVAAVLAGERSYDSLAGDEQVFVRVVWDARIEAARMSLDLAAEFRAEDRVPWVEADVLGRTVYRS